MDSSSGEMKLTPADHKTQSLVDPFTRHANEATSDGHVRGHFSLAVVDQTEHAGVDGVREEKRTRAALDQTTGDGDERCRSDGTTLLLSAHGRHVGTAPEWTR